MKRRTAVKRRIKDGALAIAPKGLEKWVLGLLGGGRQRGHNYWSGDFETWEEALSGCTGYDTNAVLSKVRDALLAVQAGHAAYERDSVLFENPDYVWPVVALLSQVAARENNRLSVLDFGGSLGSTYFQHRRCFDWLDELSWNIVEQKHFVACGQKDFADSELKFYESVAECLANESPNVVLLSSVLPYLEDPYGVLEELIQRRIPYMLIDRTPVLTTGDGDRLTVQKVPSTIYRASYPAWFFNREKLTDFLCHENSLVFEFDAIDGEVTLQSPLGSARSVGWFLQRKDR